MRVPAAPPPTREAVVALHTTASEMSIVSRGAFDDESDDIDGSEESDGPPALAPAEDADGAPRLDTRAERKRLATELLDALYLGTSNFFLAYNTRAGIAIILRALKLLQRRQFAAVVDLRQLLGEPNLSFRVDAVRLGLFLGWFTGGYRGLRALLPFVLRRLVRPKGEQQQRRVEQASSLAAGALAAGAIVACDAKRRRSLALYALTRALQCAYNTAKRKQYWHFWGSDWRYGDALLFALASAQVMYAYVMRPQTLPPEYFRFIQNTGPVELETLELVQLVNRGLPINKDTLHGLVARTHIHPEFPLPGSGDIIPCRLVHCDADSCVAGWVLCFRNAFVRTFPLYLSLFIVPGVVIHFKKFVRSPVRTLAYSVLNATRSNTFLASFVTLYLATICAHRRVVSTDHRLVYYVAGLVASTTILLEPKSRRSELGLYVLPRAIDSLAMILHDRKIFTGFKNGEVALFSASMAVMMYCYEHEKEAVSPFLYSTMRRFLQTSTDKMDQYLATHNKQQQQESKDTKLGVRTA